MNRILVIGAGSVGAAVVRKLCQLPEIIEIGLAARHRRKCDAVAQQCDQVLFTAAVDAADIPSLTSLMQRFNPTLVINCALPVHNLPIMEACLQNNAHYIDTSAPEPDPGRYQRFTYSWPLAFKERFRRAGLTALLSIGFDPGTSSIFCSYADRHLFDDLRTIDIIDCNGGDNGHPFATNFNATVNILDVIQPGMFREKDGWQEIDPFSVRRDMDLPGVGRQPMYLLYHDELESLGQRFPKASLHFWMHLSDSYLEHIRVLRNVGLTSLAPVAFNNTPIVPLDFLSRLLPEPSSLASEYTGQTTIGCLMTGIKNGRPKKYFLYNSCDHQQSFRQLGSNAIAYTAAIPAVLAARLLLDNHWSQPGVHLPEQLDPDPFMEQLPAMGLTWTLEKNPQIEYIPLL